jgi:hypothetical protein
MGDISEPIESAAWETALVRSVLFTQAGNRRRSLPYLALRALDLPSGRAAFKRLRAYVLESIPDEVDADASRLLQSINWRLHGIAAVTLLVSGRQTDELLHRLWYRLRSGSAVAPALCAAASMVDRNFAVRAHALLADRECFYRTTVALDALLALSGSDIPYSHEARENLLVAKAEDHRLHRSSELEAQHWREDAARCLAAA